MKLSILDQSPVSKGQTPSEALHETVELAKIADELGYTRLWVSEHHFAKTLAGSSPEVLIAYMAAVTKQIRLGSGGVMLPHYSPYKVAENFRVLEGLAPNRIDLGLGRAPGGMPLATRALQEGSSPRFGGADYGAQLDDLVDYLSDGAPADHRFAGLVATPEVDTTPEAWLLGSSGGSALNAAQRGFGFAFAHFINGQGGQEVMDYYRHNFMATSFNETPQTLVSIFVTCAETTEEAERLASSLDLSLLLLEKGVSSTGTPTPEEAAAYQYSFQDQFRIAENRKRMIVGNPEDVARQLQNLADSYGTDEVMIASMIADKDAKQQSLRLIMDAVKAMV
ncbi:LLM class flavin-dependent oxidoreductase [Exiguobacterium artemiae]